MKKGGKETRKQIGQCRQSIPKPWRQQSRQAGWGRCPCSSQGRLQRAEEACACSRALPGRNLHSHTRRLGIN